MDPKRVLIVEPDNAFALSLASLFRDDGCATAVAASAAEAELEIASRRPDLCVVRAELPDLSGFSLCARLRHDAATARLPVVLYASETPPEALAEHARTPWAADGYLAMPLDTDALRSLAARILAAAEPVESADEMVIEEADEVAAVEAGAETAGAGEVAAEAEDAAPGSPAPGVGDEAAAAPADAAGPPEGGGEAAETPPPVPQRPHRTVLTDDDRLFADRVFRSVAEHRDALVAEAHHRRPPPRRDLLQTPEGRLQLLREDLKWREAQLARLAEVWEVRERELSTFDERIHDKDVEIQGLKGQVEDLLRRLAGARDVFVAKEREYGASIDGLLLEKFGQEKELIEVIAANERRIHELEREARRRDDDLAQRRIALSEAEEEVARLERQARADAARNDDRERELQTELARRAEELASAEEALAASRRGAEEADRAARALLDEAATRQRALEADLEGLRTERAAEARTAEESRVGRRGADPRARGGAGRGPRGGGGARARRSRTGCAAWRPPSPRRRGARPGRPRRPRGGGRVPRAHRRARGGDPRPRAAAPAARRGVPAVPRRGARAGGRPHPRGPGPPAADRLARGGDRGARPRDGRAGGGDPRRGGGGARGRAGAGRRARARRAGGGGRRHDARRGGRADARRG